jgi:transcriptional regulator with XRE-family HTH domain
MVVRNEIAGFNTRLTEKMAERGVSQADLCRLTGLASSMVSHYCTGQRVPSVQVAVKIARVLRTTVEHLAADNRPKAGENSDNALLAAEDTPPYNASRQPIEHREDEQSLYLKFCLLNKEGQAKVLEYLEDMLSIDKYI